MIYKILLIFCLFSVIFFLTLALGESIALRNKYPKFTKWWRKNWVGLEDDLY